MSRSGTILSWLARAKRARACLIGRSSALKLKRSEVTPGGRSVTAGRPTTGATRRASAKASSGRRRAGSAFTTSEQGSRRQGLGGRGDQDFLSHGNKLPAMGVHHPGAGRDDGFEHELPHVFAGAADAVVQHRENRGALYPHRGQAERFHRRGSRLGEHGAAQRFSRERERIAKAVTWRIGRE